MIDTTIIILIVLAILAPLGYLTYQKYQKMTYQKYQKRKKIEKFEKSLLDLQTTVKEAILTCKDSLPQEGRAKQGRGAKKNA